MDNYLLVTLEGPRKLLIFKYYF